MSYNKVPPTILNRIFEAEKLVEISKAPVTPINEEAAYVMQIFSDDIKTFRDWRGLELVPLHYAANQAAIVARLLREEHNFHTKVESE